MSLTVTHGAIVEVNPDELRTMAQRVDNVPAEARRAQASCLAADQHRALVPPEIPIGWTGRTLIPSRLDRVIHDLETLAVSLRHAADVYELVEGRMRAYMFSEAGATVPEDELVHLVRLRHAHPDAAAAADRAFDAWQTLTRMRMVNDWAYTPSPSPFIRGGDLAMVLTVGLSMFRAGARMGPGSTGELRRQQNRSGSAAAGPPPRMEVATSRSAAPSTIAESIRRIPNDEGNGYDARDRVRVDRYTMPDGSARYVTYIAGSQGNPLDPSDPWSWQRNLGLYLGERESAGYDFTVEALRQAGAQPGDVVEVHGFSQGAMIAQRVATDSDFDVQRVTIVGSPQHAVLGDDATALTIAHTDDPVAALAAGGSPSTLADEDSVLVTRRHADGGGPLWDPWVAGSHRVNSYAETARVFEESGDPRVGGFREHLADLGGAESVERFVFSVPEQEKGD
ncbi:hypothetical protein [Microbacterium amylolyticum]|uniref:Alpha/beta hydrolase n=1 Tax=Microbacterium amylolyticum TaxID=936337 RepID=A0ABS4ZI72_9MICO|nr:hypothetical protein [Microbacterium amylolyticum]MBP2436979.1 hypothetical protein [Microbacterium amylolyticum]